MLSLETLLAFVPVVLVLAVAPGPDNIFVLTQAALGGRSAGLAVTLGLATGVIVHTLAVALGVAVIFQTSELAFTALKLAGVIYLVYLAWQAWRASSQRIALEAAPVVSRRALYARGVLMNVTNPKVSIFFLAFLPQFADPARGSVPLQIVALGGVFILSTILVFGGVAFVAGALGEWLNASPRAQKVLNRIAATVFLGLAAKLLLTRRA